MKKIFVLCLMILCVIVVGCSKEKDTFKHYDLKDKKINTYIYYNDNKGKEEYALADLTEGDMTITTGFFYKISDNDYILLKTLESSNKDAYKKTTTYQFFDNKLYGVGNGNTPLYFEIDLKGKNSMIEEKEFFWNQKKVGPVNLKSIDNNYITFYGYVSLEEEAMAGRTFKCSLKDYQCEMQDNM